jgi:cellobiose phosphorylase
MLAMIRSGRSREAKAMLDMLLPPNHSDSKEAAERYRVEPYVMAADVYSAPPNTGRGGWTWYTGAAAWMYNCILAILGYERRGSAVRLGMMPGFWDEAAVTIPFGTASYRLVCRTDCETITLDDTPIEGPFITMIDDGMPHTAIFPIGRCDRQRITAVFELTEIIRH